MLCGLLALHLGHDLDLGLGHGRTLLGGGKAVLEGGDLGHQVALGQECVVQLSLGFNAASRSPRSRSISSTMATASAWSWTTCLSSSLASARYLTLAA